MDFQFLFCLFLSLQGGPLKEFLCFSKVSGNGGAGEVAVSQGKFRIRFAQVRCSAEVWQGFVRLFLIHIPVAQSRNAEGLIFFCQLFQYGKSLGFVLWYTPAIKDAESNFPECINVPFLACLIKVGNPLFALSSSSKP